MDFFVIRSKKKLEELFEVLKTLSLPMKIAVQEVFPLRPPDVNAYYWGVILDYISRETGMTPEEVHEGYKIKFRYTQEFRYNPKTKQWQFYIGTGSTVVDERLFWEYIEKVVSDAWHELHIVIPRPSEVFCNELDFRHQTKKL